MTGGQRNQGHGVVLHDQGEGYHINQAQLLEEGVAKYLNLDLVSLTHPNPVLNRT